MDFVYDSNFAILVALFILNNLRIKTTTTVFQELQCVLIIFYLHNSARDIFYYSQVITWIDIEVLVDWKEVQKKWDMAPK